MYSYILLTTYFSTIYVLCPIKATMQLIYLRVDLCLFLGGNWKDAVFEGGAASNRATK